MLAPYLPNQPQWMQSAQRHVGSALVNPDLQAAWIAAALLGPKPGIRVFHGTQGPQFETFDPAKIGTGIGHQTYGYGHHFSSERSIAEAFSGLGQTPGSVMERSLSVAPEALLDFDKPFKEQSPQVQKALQTINPTWKNMSGDQIFDLLRYQSGGKSPAAAETLRAAGIPGARYTVGGTPGQQYVMFPGSENLIEQ